MVSAQVRRSVIPPVPPLPPKSNPILAQHHRFRPALTPSPSAAAMRGHIRWSYTPVWVVIVLPVASGSASRVVTPFSYYHPNATTQVASQFQAYLLPLFLGWPHRAAVSVTGKNGGPFSIDFGSGITGGTTLAKTSGSGTFGKIGPITGSLIIDPSNQIITFNATSSFLQEINSVREGVTSAILPDGTYTVTLTSGSGGQWLR